MARPRTARVQAERIQHRKEARRPRRMAAATGTPESQSMPTPMLPRRRRRATARPKQTVRRPRARMEKDHERPRAAATIQA